MTIDTNLIKQTKTLPQYLDVTNSSIGLEYQFLNTNYRFNPLRGNEGWIQVSGGQRRIRENQVITDLGKWGNDGFDYGTLYDTLPTKSYVFLFKGNASQFIPLGKQSTIKTAVNAGWLQTEMFLKMNYFRSGATGC